MFELLSKIKSILTLILPSSCSLDDRRLSRGKLERVWPPPSNVDQTKPEQTQVMHQVTVL